MAPNLKQKNRLASLKTKLGEDVLVLTRFEADEGVSELFEIRVEALSNQANIDFGSVIGTGCQLTTKLGQDVERIFHGVLVESEWIGRREHNDAYRLVLRPWPYLLSFTGNCRIFKDKTVVDIVRSVFEEKGFSDFRFEVTGSYPTLEYCVQYRESDLAFVLRLLEEHGIYYHFEHADQKHVMVLVDRSSSHKAAPGCDSVICDHDEVAGAAERNHVWGWIAQRRFTTGRSAYGDYDYNGPRKKMLATHQSSLPFEHGSLEDYDWHGRYEQLSVGQDKVKAHQQAHEVRDRRRFSAGAVPGLTPGFKVKVEKNAQAAENGDYLVVRCRHAYVSEAYRTGGVGATYDGSYEFVPMALQFRAPMATPRPRIAGTQTARVVGREGEEIDVDAQGRILVDFFWDRDHSISRRVRVAQVWAGKNWGGIVIPRIGMEVVVTFIEGDPDQPLVIGTVYNGENKVPYDLPANKNVSGIKSESTKGGSGYNEFVFDDTKDAEKIRMHAEMDLEVTVDNTETRTIKGEKVSMGTPARKTTIEKGDEILKVSSGHRKEEISQGDDSLKIGMGNRSCEISMGNDDLTLKMGNRTTKLKLGKDLTEALQSITLKVMSSSVTIDPMGVTIKGPMIKLQADAMISTKAPMTTIQSDGMTIVKGGVVMIN